MKLVLMNWESSHIRFETQAPNEKVDANKVKFVIPLKSREQRTFTYDLTTRHGVNATK